MPVLGGFDNAMDRILLLGANGQVGWELSRSLLPLGDVTALTRNQCDLSDMAALANVLRNLRPDIIVNAAAYTAVDQAEINTEMAMCINAEAPAVLADEARRLGALLVDYSTDYVFDGAKSEAYVETDTPNPINVYGRSKLAGLQAIKKSGCRHLIFRVSWVYGGRGSNFVKSMLRLAKDHTELNVVEDQVGAPTSADLIADVTSQVLTLTRRGLGEEGVFHLAPSGETSWYGFAQAIFDHVSSVTGSTVPRLSPIKAIEYPALAQRPANSRLNTAKIERTFGLYMPRWQTSMKRIIEEVIKP